MSRYYYISKWGFAIDVDTLERWHVSLSRLQSYLDNGIEFINVSVPTMDTGFKYSSLIASREKLPNGESATIYDKFSDYYATENYSYMSDDTLIKYDEKSKTVFIYYSGVLHRIKCNLGYFYGIYAQGGFLYVYVTNENDYLKFGASEMYWSNFDKTYYKHEAQRMSMSQAKRSVLLA